MATYTDNGTNTPNGSHKVFTYTFPALQTEDIKVALNGVTQATTKYTASLSPAQIEFNNTNIDSSVQESTGAPKTGVQVRVFRETTVGKNSGDEDPKAVFAAGSSIRAADLNANQEQALFAIHELQTQPIKTSDIEPDAITNSKIVDNAIDSEHYVDGSIDRVHLAADIVDGTKIADNSIDSEHYVDGSIDVEHLADNSVDRASIVNDSVNGDKIADDSIDSEHYVDGSIDEQHIANSAVTSNKIANNAVTTTEINNGAITTQKIGAGQVTLDKLADNSVNTNRIIDGNVTRVKLEADIIDSTKLADNAVNSEHYVDGSIDRVHLAADIVDGTKIADDSIDSEHIVAGALDNEHYAAGSITADKLNGATVVTNSEQAASTPNDTSFFTTAAAEARYFNASTGETIKDGQTFPDNDTTIATTAAINDRIIDLVDGVGGFVPIDNQNSFPTENPDINNPPTGGTIVSVQTATTNLTAQSGTTLTLPNGRGTGNAVIITGVSSTIPSGFGFLVETTSTDHTYAFHRLVPKATEVTTVAGKATEIGRLGTAAAVEDMSILGTTDVVADMNLLGTTDVVADMNMLATTDVISDMNTLAVTSVLNNIDTVATNVANVNTTAGSISNVNTTAGSISNVNTVAGSISNVNSVAGSISNVNTTAGSIANVNSVASNMANVNNFADRYQIAANNPSTDGGGNALAAGDLYFNTSANELKVYNGSSWQGGVTATGNFAVTTGNTFTGDNRYNDGVKATFGTGSDLEIFHGGTNSLIRNNTGGGTLFIQGNGDAGKYVVLQPKPNEDGVVTRVDGATELHYDNSKKFETTSYGAKVTDFLNVGKTNTPSKALELYQASNAALRIQNSSTGVGSSDGFLLEQSGLNSLLVNYEAGNIEFKTANNSRLRIEAGGDIKVTGDKAIFFGASDDLMVGHDGTSTRIEDNYGYFTIKSNALELRSNTGSELYIKNTVNAAVELYYDNSKKLETTSDGVVFTGAARFVGNETGFLTGKAHPTLYRTASTSGSYPFNNFGHLIIQTRNDGSNRDIIFATGTNSTKLNRITSDGHLDLFGDNQRLRLGASQDLELYHTGSANHIDSSTPIAIRSDVFQISTLNGTHKYIDIPTNEQGVELYYDNSKKLETTNQGIKVAGAIRVGNGVDMRIHNDNGSETLANFINNGAVELYYDNSKKFETYTNGTKLYGHLIGLDAGKYIQWQGANSNAFAIGMTSGADSPTGSDNHLQFHHWNNSSWDKVFFVHRDYINIPDSKYIGFGNSNDLKIQHDGTDNYIESTGKLYIKSSNFVDIRSDGNETMIKATPNGSVELYHNNNKHFETATNGGIFRGTTWTAVDNCKFAFGNGDDFKIYHTGSESIVGNETGTLQILSPNEIRYRATTHHFLSYGNDETMAKFNDDGAVDLYYNNSKKFETNSEGVRINGYLEMLDNQRIQMGNGDDLQLWHDGNNSALYNGTGTLFLRTNTLKIRSADGNEDFAEFFDDAQVRLYYDNSIKLETHSNGTKVNGVLGVGLDPQSTNNSTYVVQGKASDQCLLIAFRTQDGTSTSTNGMLMGLDGSYHYLIGRENRPLRLGANNITSTEIDTSGHLRPTSNNTYDLGATSRRWRNVYTYDLHLSNKGSSNDVDGTWGDWTIQEGESDLFLKNNRSGKKYKFNLTEVS